MTHDQSINNSTALAYIENAFNRLERSVARDDARYFERTELRDVRQAVIDIQNQQRRKGSFHNFRRMDPFLKGVEKYAKVLDVLCNGTPFLSWIWLATEHLSSLEALLDAYAKIGECLPRFDRFATTFPSPEMQDVLALLYEDIIEFHRKTYKFFRRRAWKVMFDCTWMSFQQRFQDLLRRLRQHQDLIDKEATSFDIVEASHMRAKIDIELEKSERERIDLRLQSVLAWFGVDDTTQANFLWHLQAKRYPNTCQWIFDSSAYNVWCDDPVKQPVLWLWGKPGSGKSVISASMISQLKERTDCVVLYFFFNHQKPPTNGGCDHLLRVLASQIIRLDTDLAPLVWENHIRKGHSASLEFLCSTLPELLSASKPVRIVVDGLDEADESEHRSIIENLLQLTVNSKGHCSVVICSRNLGIIAKKLNNYSTIVLKDEQQSIERDIVTFVKGRINDVDQEWDLHLADDTKEIAIEEITRRANGMFLWVELVMNDLRFALSDDDVLAGIEKLPRDLHEAYDRILLRMRETANLSIQGKIHHILEWLTYASRPLKLVEMLNAVGCQSLGISAAVPCSETIKILDFCRPLIEISKDMTVNFVHFTAKEYLLDSTSKFHLEIVSANTNLARTCLSYLQTTQVFTDPSQREERLLQIAKGQRSLHHYVFSNWLSHIRYARKFLTASNGSGEFIKLFNEVVRQLRRDGPAVPEMQSQYNGEKYDRLGHLQFLQQIQEFQSTCSDIVTKQLSSDISSRSKTEDDPSFLSLIDSQYDKDLDELLNPSKEKSLPSCITFEVLTAFRSDQSMHLFFCRFSACSKTFDTAQQRKVHETLHTPLFQCDVLGCLFSGREFKKARYLDQHKKRYHYELIPEVVTTVRNLSDVHATMHDKITAPDSNRPIIKEAGVFPDFAGPDQNFTLDFSTLENTDTLENFDIDSFLNTSAEDTFNLDFSTLEYTNISENNDALENFDLNSFLNTSAEDTFNWDGTMSVKDLADSHPNHRKVESNPESHPELATDFAESNMPSIKLTSEQQFDERFTYDRNFVNQQIRHSLEQDEKILTGWQSTISIELRRRHVLRVWEGLMLLMPFSERCFDVAINYERKALNQQPTYEAYHREVRQKVAELYEGRKKLN